MTQDNDGMPGPDRPQTPSEFYKHLTSMQQLPNEAAEAFKRAITKRPPFGVENFDAKAKWLTEPHAIRKPAAK